MDGMNALIAQGVIPREPVLMPSQAEGNALTLDRAKIQNEAARIGLEDQQFIRPMKNEISQMAYLRDVGQSVSWENYPAFYEHAVSKIGLRPNQLPSPQQVAEMGPQNYEIMKFQNLATLDQRLKQEMQAERIKSAEALVGQKIESAEKISGERLSSAEKLAEARDKQLRELMEIRAKHAQELQDLKSEGKNLTEDQRIARALESELGRKPTDREVLDEKNRLISEAPIKPRALPADRAKELGDLQRTYKQLEGITKKAESIKDKFGPIEGRYNQLKVRFKSDGPTQEVINELESLITIAYGLSGKQITVQEMELLKKAILPRLEQPYGNFVATLSFAKKWIQDTHNSELESYKKSHYKTDIEPLGEKGNTIGRFKVEVE